MTRLGNSNALRLPVLLSHFFLPLLRLSLFNPFPILTYFLLALFPYFSHVFFLFLSVISRNSPISTNINLHLSVSFFPFHNPSFLSTILLSFSQSFFPFHNPSFLFTILLSFSQSFSFLFFFPN